MEDLQSLLRPPAISPNQSYGDPAISFFLNLSQSGQSSSKSTHRLSPLFFKSSSGHQESQQLLLIKSKQPDESQIKLRIDPEISPVFYEFKDSAPVPSQRTLPGNFSPNHRINLPQNTDSILNSINFFNPLKHRPPDLRLISFFSGSTQTNPLFIAGSSIYSSSKINLQSIFKNQPSNHRKRPFNSSNNHSSSGNLPGNLPCPDLSYRSRKKSRTLPCLTEITSDFFL